ALARDRRESRALVVEEDLDVRRVRRRLEPHARDAHSMARRERLLDARALEDATAPRGRSHAHEAWRRRAHAGGIEDPRETGPELREPRARLDARRLDAIAVAGLGREPNLAVDVTVAPVLEVTATHRRRVQRERAVRRDLERDLDLVDRIGARAQRHAPSLEA